MVPEKNGRRYTPRFKFQVVMEILSGTKAIGQIARSYGVHPVILNHWKKEFIEKGPEIFSQQTTIQECEKRIEDLERLIGHAQRKRSYEEKHSNLRQPLFEIARHHPEYGYRRTKAALWDRGIPVNRKVVERLHLAWDLAVIRRIRKSKTSSVAKLL